MTLQFPRGATQFYGISNGKKSFALSIIFKGKETNLKEAGFLLKKKYVIDPPCLGFSRIAQESLVSYNFISIESLVYLL